MVAYSVEVQKNYIEFLLSSNSIYSRCQNIIDAKYFDSELGNIVSYIKEYSDKYSVVPLISEVNATFSTTFEQIDNIAQQHEQAFLDMFEQFCRHRAIEITIRTAPEKMSKSNYADIETELKNALLISLQKDLGTEYYVNPRERLERMMTRNAMVSTGWKDIDKKLYGGFNRGEISIFAANSGMGKSLFLQNLALNWSQQGLFVVYISFELSEELVSMRLDSMLNDIPTKDVFRRIDDVEAKLAIMNKKHGPIQVKYMNSGSSANDIRAFLKELEIKMGRRPDALCIDYLDLMYPNNKKINPSDLFIKDKFVTEELRQIAVDYGCLMATASQLGRGAVEEQDHDQSHIAGGISKINTADNVMTIYASATMKERGEYQVNFLKTRSSSGVGSRVRLAFSQVSLRIFDAPDEDDFVINDNTPSVTAMRLKNKVNNAPKEQATAIETENKSTESTRLARANGILKGLNL